MDATESALVRRLREADLPRAMRGFQEETTRQLLEQAAKALNQVALERDSLRRRAEAASAAASEDDGPDAEAIGRAFVTATSVSDQLVASATEKAELLLSQAQTEADNLLTEARAAVDELARETASRRAAADEELARAQQESERIREQAGADRDALLTKALDHAERTVADEASRVDHLRREADGLGAFLEAQKRAFVEVAEAALAKLDELQAARLPGLEPSAEELLDDLHPADHISTAPASPGGDAAPPP